MFFVVISCNNDGTLVLGLIINEFLLLLYQPFSKSGVFIGFFRFGCYKEFYALKGKWTPLGMLRDLRLLKYDAALIWRHYHQGDLSFLHCLLFGAHHCMLQRK